MNTAVLNVKTDPETKQRLKAFAAQVGLPVSALMNAQIKQMLRDGKVIFSTSLEPTAYLQKLIKEAEADYAAGKDITTISNAAELDTFFDSL